MSSETLTPAQEIAAPTLPPIQGELRQLPLDNIYIGGNYRLSRSAPGLAELAESIRHSGLIQPATVRPLAEPIEGRQYALVAGGRRYAAHQRPWLKVWYKRYCVEGLPIGPLFLLV